MWGSIQRAHAHQAYFLTAIISLNDGLSSALAG